MLIFFFIVYVRVSFPLYQGTAGEDLPQVLIPSYVACELDSPDTEEVNKSCKYKSLARAGDFAVSSRRDHVDVTTPFGADGLIEDWDLFETLLSHTLTNELYVNSRENALLFADPNHNGRKPREHITELLFEKFEAPAVFLARSAVLSAYANGRTTGIVLDVGHSGTSAVPVEDGTIVKGKSIRTAVGGRTMTNVLSAVLQEKDVQLRPIWSYKRTITGTEGIDEESVIRRSKVKDLFFPNTRDSFVEFTRTRLLEEIKAGLCIVHDNPTDELKSLPMLMGSYELPDGNVIDLGVERFQVAEETVFGRLQHLVSDSGAETRLSYVNQYINGGRQGEGGEGKASNGLHGLVVDAIKMCDPSIHRDMYAGVCLTGGTSDLSGLFERLSFGLMEKYHKVRILAATKSLERKYCAWTGGSILATFSEHQKNWLSRSEFDENGSSFIHRKCQ